MTQLRALDAVFLALETPETPAEIGGLAILDPSTAFDGTSAGTSTAGAAAGEPFDFDRFVDFCAERLALCPRFSWKIHEVPLGLDLPYWVDDEELDLRRHIHRAALPSPGGAQELSQLAGHLYSLPLDRTRPLWEMYVIEGLQGGRVALLWKLHHCLMDGESGAGLVELLFDLAPEPASRPLVAVNSGEALGEAPGLGPMLRRSIGNAARRNVAAARHVGGMVRSWANTALSDEDAVEVPHAPFNGAVSSRRAVGWTTVPLEPLKQVKNQLEVTVNDVILGLTGGAIRRYLEDRGELPDDTLYAVVPMSTRKRGDTSVNNQVREMAVEWGTDIEDPVERILRINASTRAAKREASEGGPNLIEGMAESLAPAAIQLVSRLGAAIPDRIPLPGNAVVSNVRMTDFPFYIAGAKVVGMVPMSMLAPTQGLNITVVTYCGELHFGVISDPRLCAEPGEIAEGIAKGLEDLQAAAEQFEAAGA